MRNVSTLTLSPQLTRRANRSRRGPNRTGCCRGHEKFALSRAIPALNLPRRLEAGFARTHVRCGDPAIRLSRTGARKLSKLQIHASVTGLQKFTWVLDQRRATAWTYDLVYQVVTAQTAAAETGSRRPRSDSILLLVGLTRLALTSPARAGQLFVRRRCRPGGFHDRCERRAIVGVDAATLRRDHPVDQ